MRSKIGNHYIYFDYEDKDLIKSLDIFVEKCRNKFIPRVRIDGKKPMLHKVLLKYPKERITFKDGNPLNCQKRNLIVITEDIRQQHYLEYMKQNEEHFSKYRKNYYKKNKKKIKQRVKEWNLKNRDRYNDWLNAHRRTIGKKWSELKRNARRRFPDKKFNLTKEQYEKILKKGCYYCHCDLSKFVGSSLDRINNSKGYEKGNVVACCGRCNRTRGDAWTVEETKVMIDAVIEYRKKKAP